MTVQLPQEIAHIPTEYGLFSVFTVSSTNEEEHVVIVNPEMKTNPPLVRVHSECFTADVMGSKRCDCAPQLHRAQELIGEQGGVLIYLRQEGRGIGLTNKLKAYALQENGRDTVDANTDLGLPVDGRTYEDAVRVLKQLGIDSVRLMTNNPKKVAGLEAEGISVVERVPLVIPPNPYNQKYIDTKRERLGHVL